MPEYYAIRLTLFLTELSLLSRIASRRAGLLLPLLLYLSIDCIANLEDAVRFFYPYPFGLHDPTWDRFIWLPLSLIRVLLSVYVSLDLFSFLIPRTNIQERRLLCLFALLTGVIVCLRFWSWSPSNLFQAVMTIRQYILLTLFVGTSVTWMIVRYVKVVELPTELPVECAFSTQTHAHLWIGWLFVLFALSTTGEGGLARRLPFLVWDGSIQTWRWMADGLLSVQLCLLCGWLTGFHRYSPPRLTRVLSRPLISPTPSLSPTYSATSTRPALPPSTLPTGTRALSTGKTQPSVPLH